MEGHSYILLYLVTKTNKKWQYYYVSCHRSNEWQVKLIKMIYNINKQILRKWCYGYKGYSTYVG